MQPRLYLAAFLLVPALVLSQDCLETPEAELFETAQRAWVEYRDATCELFTEREREDLQAEARATCLAFYTRERAFELRLMSRVLTLTNVRAIFSDDEPDGDEQRRADAGDDSGRRAAYRQ